MKKPKWIKIRCSENTYRRWWTVAGKHNFNCAEDAINYFIDNFEEYNKMFPFKPIRRKNL